MLFAISCKGQVKYLKDLIIPIGEWKILEEKKVDSYNVGYIILSKNMKSHTRYELFYALYQKHSIEDLREYAEQEKKREVRHFKKQGVEVSLMKTLNVPYNGENAILYTFKGKDDYIRDITTKLLVFKRNGWYYRISYIVSSNSENLINSIKLKETKKIRDILLGLEYLKSLGKDLDEVIKLNKYRGKEVEISFLEKPLENTKVILYPSDNLAFILSKYKSLKSNKFIEVTT